jgi:hypothetical protein
LVRLSVATCGALVLVSAISAYAAANSVPRSKVVDYSTAITANALKPSECAGLSLSNVITGRDEINGSSGNDLILGSEREDTIRGNNGNDCILGGSGEDTLYGNSGGDVLIGGGDSDELDGGGGSDVCYRGGGDDNTYDSCEQER